LIHFLLENYALELSYNSQIDISWQSISTPVLPLTAGVEYYVNFDG
jgi:hypothetical protein